MATGRSIGTIYAELDLDSSRYMKSQQQLLKDATSTTLNIEKNFKNLGIKSSAEMDLMRAKIQNSYERILNSSKATANDIIRAEEAKNAKLKALNEQQFGKQTTLIESMKKNWIAATVAISAALGVMYKAWDLAKMGADYDEQRGILDNLAKKYKTSAEEIITSMRKASDELIADADLMKVALGGIAKGLNPEQLTNLADAARILGDAVGKDATTALKDLTEALETGRTKGLKNYLGTAIDLEAVFGKLYVQLNEAEKAQALYNITMIEATKLQAQQSKEVDEAGDRLERLEAKYKNLTLTIAIFAKTMVVELLDIQKNAVNAVDAMGGMFEATTKAADSATESTQKEKKAVEETIAPYQKQIDALKKLIEGRKNNEDAAGKHTASMDKERAAAERLNEQWLDTKRTLEANIEMSEMDDLTKVLIKNQLEADKLKEKFKNLTGPTKTEAFSLIDKAQLKADADAIKEFGDKYEKEAIATNEKITESAKKTADERAKAERDMYEDMRGYEGKFYDSSIVLINSQAEKYRELGISEVAILKWVAEETEKAAIKKAESEEDFFEGVSAGFKKLKKEQETWGKAGVKIVADMSNAMSDTFSDVFEDAYKGKLKTIRDYSNAIWDSIRKSFFDMIGKLAAKKIMMYFESQWTAGGADVLKIVNSVLGIAGNVFSSTDTYGVDAAGGGGMHAGGFVPGYAYGGDSPANDTIHAMLSPGEYVIPRSVVSSIARKGRYGDTMIAHINETEARLLKSIGGSGTINPATGLPEFGFWSKAANIFSGGLHGAITGDWGGTKDLWSFLNPGLISGYKTAHGHDFWDIVDAAFDPVTGPGIDNLVRSTGKKANEIIPWIGQVVDVVAPIVGAILGSYGGPAGTAGGAAAGSGFASKFNQASNEEAIKKAAVTAAVTYIASSAAQYASQAAGGGTGGKIAGNLTNRTVAYATKWILSQLYPGAYPVESGQLSVQYKGMEDNGMLSDLGGYFKSLAPANRYVSAKSGLDYVPRDNYLINAHKGEAVLNKKDAKEWRGAGDGAALPPVQINLVLNGRALTSYLYKQTKDGIKVIHERGITNV
jgi:hypothetical protein